MLFEVIFGNVGSRVLTYLFALLHIL